MNTPEKIKPSGEVRSGRRLRSKPPILLTHSALYEEYTPPELYEDAQDHKRPYARSYDFRRTRSKLLRKALLQWMITVIIAIAIAGTLLGYEKRATLDKAQKHLFNALITGLAIALGINLASSLRSYAALLRWRLLSCSWLSLQEFDLILGCSSQRNLLQLLFSRSDRRKFPYMSTIRILGALWIIVNAAAQILVATLGFVYSLDTASQTTVTPGLTIIADLSDISQSSAHQYGLRGPDISIVSVAEPLLASKMEEGPASIFTDVNFSSMIYRFRDYNPTNPTIEHPSLRVVNVTAVCNLYSVTGYAGAYGNGQRLLGNFFFYNDIYNTNQSLYVRNWDFGSTTYISDNDLHCGNRCTRVFLYQAGAQSNISSQQPPISGSTISDCNNTVSRVTNITADGQNFTLPDGDKARTITGASGWTGYVPSISYGVYDHLEAQLFSSSSYWSPPDQITKHGRESAARYVAQYSAAVLALMDRDGSRQTIKDGQQPQQASIVTVEWGNLLAVLATVIVLQLIFVVLVVFWSSKAVIKDGSFLAIAKLLAPTVMTLGEHGSVLGADELALAIDKEKGGDYRIFYGPQVIKAGQRDGHESDAGSNTVPGTDEIESPSTTVVMRADIIEKGSSTHPGWKTIFADGKYD